jgi:hypothetical protein
MFTVLDVYPIDGPYAQKKMQSLAANSVLINYFLLYAREFVDNTPLCRDADLSLSLALFSLYVFISRKIKGRLWWEFSHLEDCVEYSYYFISDSS